MLITTYLNNGVIVIGDTLAKLTNGSFSFYRTNKILGAYLLTE